MVSKTSKWNRHKLGKWWRRIFRFCSRCSNLKKHKSMWEGKKYGNLFLGRRQKWKTYLCRSDTFHICALWSRYSGVHFTSKRLHVRAAYNEILLDSTSSQLSLIQFNLGVCAADNNIYLKHTIFRVIGLACFIFSQKISFQSLLLSLNPSWCVFKGCN